MPTTHGPLPGTGYDPMTLPPEGADQWIAGTNSDGVLFCVARYGALVVTSLDGEDDDEYQSTDEDQAGAEFWDTVHAITGNN